MRYRTSSGSARRPPRLAGAERCERVDRGSVGESSRSGESGTEYGLERPPALPVRRAGEGCTCSFCSLCCGLARGRLRERSEEKAATNWISSSLASLGAGVGRRLATTAEGGAEGGASGGRAGDDRRTGRTRSACTGAMKLYPRASRGSNSRRTGVSFTTVWIVAHTRPFRTEARGWWATRRWWASLGPA